MAYLNNVVQTTRCRLVISSAWRYLVLAGSMKLAGFGYLMRTHGLMNLSDGTVDGISPVLDVLGFDPPELYPGHRGEIAKKWLELAAKFHREPMTLVAVDDMSEEETGYAKAGISYLRTDGSKGLTCDDATRLIEMLGREEVARP